MTPNDFDTVSVAGPEQTAAEDSTCECYLVRVGMHGQIGRFRPMSMSSFRRGTRVVCRTLRGIEVGQVLGPARMPTASEDLADGRVLRKMTSEDELLWGHLEQLADQSHQRCQQWLSQQGIAAPLLDVEPLLDGKTLYFHFLSEVSPDVQSQLDALVNIYEREVRESKFAQLLEHGCGPGCGTENAKNGCGSRGGCAVCKVASKCKH